MSYPNKNRSWLFFSILFLALSLVLIFGVQLNAACGGNKTCKHTEGGKSCPMHSKTTSATGTQEATSSMSQAPSLNDFSKEKLYTCPMHPEVRGKKSGKCPQCNMKLEKTEFYKVYTCPDKECPRASAKPGKCCDKELQKTVMSRQEYYAFAQLQDEYFCPMHSDVTSSEPGKCSKCGMNLEARTVSKPVEKAEEKAEAK